MPITAMDTADFIRSSLWTPQDAADALAILNAGKAAKYGDYSDRVTEKDRKGKNGKIPAGTVVPAEAVARSQGVSLVKLIQNLDPEHRRFSIRTRRTGPGAAEGTVYPAPARVVSRNGKGRKAS